MKLKNLLITTALICFSVTSAYAVERTRESEYTDSKKCQLQQCKDHRHSHADSFYHSEEGGPYSFIGEPRDPNHVYYRMKDLMGDHD